MIKYLTQEEAKQIDEVLMSSPGFSIDQLMELAVAQSIENEYKPDKYKKVLVICGPGNNGGDGLVAARHLKVKVANKKQHFGFLPSIVYPINKAQTDLFKNLIFQLKSLNIPIFDTLENITDYNLIVDGIFGFSFKGVPREPFLSIIALLNKRSVPLISIDIPSGWDVEKGRISSYSVSSPEMLVSLTCPKIGVQDYKGKHYLGGRFIPDYIREKFNISIPAYEGSSQFLDITKFTSFT